MFEDTEYKQVDLSGLAELSLEDNIAIERQLKLKNADPDYGMLHCSMIAARVNRKPWDFCGKMKHRDAIRLQAIIKAFTFARASIQQAETKRDV